MLNSPVDQADPFRRSRRCGIRFPTSFRSIGSTSIEETNQVKNLVLSGMFLSLTFAVVGCGGEGGSAPAPAAAPAASAPAVAGDAPGAPGAPAPAAPAEKPAEKK